MRSVVVLDYGSGNVRSAVRALERVGAAVTLTADPDLVLGAAGLVVPGVGAFAACMRGLAAVDAGRLVRSRLDDGRPVLGICVGMQVLFQDGVEHAVETAGLGFFEGRVERLDAPVLPHMGWNTVDAPTGSALFAGMDGDARFYFVHSYAVRHATDGLVTKAHHGSDFVAAIERGPLSATQFHPEKSGDTGARLLENWVRSLA